MHLGTVTSSHKKGHYLKLYLWGNIQKNWVNLMKSELKFYVKNSRWKKWAYLYIGYSEEVCFITRSCTFVYMACVRKCLITCKFTEFIKVIIIEEVLFSFFGVIFASKSKFLPQFQFTLSLGHSPGIVYWWNDFATSTVKVKLIDTLMTNSRLGGGKLCGGNNLWLLFKWS